MNEKAKKFEAHVEELKKQGFDWFQKEELQDEYNTVVFHGHVTIKDTNLPVFIVLDNTALSFVRVGITPNAVDKRYKNRLFQELNSLNAKYKVSKYYLNEDDNYVYMDMSIPVLDDDFEPTLVTNMLLNIVEPHLQEVWESIIKVATPAKGN